ncbi:MAG: TonB C-terminal domain-containing protein [Acidobacteriota bacterium]|jgi:outer membrane biosynthesis protein TonB|nr:TonB C-terminal domain-containing protein [Acidobacteriota bacterium]
MNRNGNRVTMLQIPLTEEKYGRAAMISLAVHGATLLVLIFGVKLFPQTVIQIGTGPGGGSGGADIATVGVVDQFSGGAGMFKPSMVPQPPALVPEPEKEQPKIPEAENNAIPIPEKIEAPKKQQPAPKTEPKAESKPDPKPEEPKSATKPAAKPATKTTAKPKEAAQPTGNKIPVEARPGSGGVAGTGAGSGGGIGGGSGIYIGAGSGGFGDSWYAQAVERRISSGWIRPPEGMRVDVTYSFYINKSGVIYDIKREKSSGNQQIDLSVERAISLVKNLPAPPLEFQGNVIQFVARFVHPPGSLDE